MANLAGDRPSDRFIAGVAEKHSISVYATVCLRPGYLSHNACSHDRARPGAARLVSGTRRQPPPGANTHEVFCNHQQSRLSRGPGRPCPRRSRAPEFEAAPLLLIHWLFMVTYRRRWLVWSSEGFHTGGSPAPRVVRTARQLQEPESTRSWPDFPPVVSRQLFPSLGVFAWAVGPDTAIHQETRQPDRHALSPANATLTKPGDNGREPACFCFLYARLGLRRTPFEAGFPGASTMEALGDPQFDPVCQVPMNAQSASRSSTSLTNLLSFFGQAPELVPASSRETADRSQDQPSFQQFRGLRMHIWRLAWLA